MSSYLAGCNLVRRRLRNHRTHLWIALLCTTLTVPASLPGQEPLLATGTRSLALGGAAAALRADPQAIFHNPAALTGFSSPQVALFYQRPFGMRELSVGTVSIAIPVRPLHVGVGLYTFGNRLFRQQALLLGFAAALRPGVNSAVSIRYQRTTIAGYGSRGRLGVDVAMFAQPTQRLDWGFYLRQLDETVRTGGELAVGLGYRPSEELYVIAEVFDDPQFEPDFRFGVEVRVAALLTLRAGGALSPGRFSAGFGLQKSGIAVDYAFFTHSDLGLTHQFGVVLSAGHKSRKASRQTAAERAYTVDLNTATEEDLRALPGVGATLAARILAYRAEHGPFRRLEELLNVPGIGKLSLERLRPFLRIRTEVQP